MLRENVEPEPVTMTPAAGYTIQSFAAHSDGKVLWQAQTQTPALWTFVVQGIARDDDHSVNFFGNLAPTTTGSGSGKVTTDFAVAGSSPYSVPTR